MKVEDHQKRSETVGPHTVGVTSYRMGSTWHASVDNASNGAVLARGEGSTREAAEKVALGKAKTILGKAKAPAAAAAKEAAKGKAAAKPPAKKPEAKAAGAKGKKKDEEE
ncbi:MAG: hypothetical protein L0216_18005 [Planctomycetales bacterium]|nr:hypothetical protein [Planctomycetales bacterium]